MEQFIFIGVIVLFAILDGVAKKKKREAQKAQKAQQAQQAQQTSYEPTPEEADAQWEPAGEELQSYEAESSSGGDDDGIPGEPLPRYTQQYASHPQQPAPAAGGAQGLIPKDIWEEITALAAGGAAPEPEPQPQQPYLVPAPAPVEEPRPTRGPDRPEHRAHAAHAKYGTPVSERLQPMDRPEMHRGPGLSPEIRSVRHLLAGGSASLRQAVILQEVLGSPVTLRDDPWTGRI